MKEDSRMCTGILPPKNPLRPPSSTVFSKLSFLLCTSCYLCKFRKKCPEKNKTGGR